MGDHGDTMRRETQGLLHELYWDSRVIKDGLKELGLHGREGGSQV